MGAVLTNGTLPLLATTACKPILYGFLAITDHGISESALSETYECLEDFFALPPQYKQALYQPELAGSRGYTPFKQEHAKDSSAPDLKEFLQMGPANNIYLNDSSLMAPLIENLMAQLHSNGLAILSAISLHLGFEEDYLPAMTEGGEHILRLLHYPAIIDQSTGHKPITDNTDHNDTSIRAAAHEDINLITLLVTATAKGLQLKVPSTLDASAQRANTDQSDHDTEQHNQWANVVVPKGAIIINLGDMLESLTNGYWKATTHRVVNPPSDDPDRYKSRYSIPYFIHGHDNFPIGPHRSILEKTGAESQYPDLTTDQYRTQHLREIGLLKEIPETQYIKRAHKENT